MQSFPLCQQCQPPITPRFALGLAAPEQIALANHADRRAVAIHNRCSTDPVSEKQLRDLGRRGIAPPIAIRGSRRAATAPPTAAAATSSNTMAPASASPRQ
jgi:hypothetical protein